jgi:predicted alternative tryptophan synthase beta-subunit
MRAVCDLLGPGDVCPPFVTDGFDDGGRYDTASPFPDIPNGAAGGAGTPERSPELVAIEPSICPTLSGGRFEYDFGDTASLTPLLAVYMPGHDYLDGPLDAG